MSEMMERTAMDYRSLLLRYIRHVRDCEGVTYITEASLNKPWSDARFTEEEVAELFRLDEEARK